VLRHRIAFDHRLDVDGGDAEQVLAEIVRRVPAP
jgi:hypothetical protein